MHLIIYLNPEGTGFTLKKNSLSDYLLLKTKQEAEEIHPIIAQIFSANSKEEVISALKDLLKVARKEVTTMTSYFFQAGGQENNYVIEESGIRENIRLSIMHEHEPDFGHHSHHSIKGVPHHHTLDEMIKFVENIDKVPENRICNIM